MSLLVINTIFALTICDLEGNLKYNVYGPDWSKNKDLKKGYYRGVDIVNNKIIAAYLGEKHTPLMRSVINL